MGGPWKKKRGPFSRQSCFPKRNLSVKKTFMTQFDDSQNRSVGSISTFLPGSLWASFRTLNDHPGYECRFRTAPATALD